MKTKTRRCRQRFQRGRIHQMAPSLIIICRRIFPETFRWTSATRPAIWCTATRALRFQRKEVNYLSSRNLGSRIRNRSRSPQRSEEHTSELQSRFDLVCRLLLEKKKKYIIHTY